VKNLAIEARGLCKSYGAIYAVRSIDLYVVTGEIFALIGPNGAGKTTTVEILEGFRTRDAGDVHVLGREPSTSDDALKQRIGIVLQSTSVDRYLTVEEVIEQFRGYYGNPLPLDEIIGIVGLNDKRSGLVRQLSGGQQRRLDVGIGLAGDPDLLFLDEPTTGFDPEARRAAWEMIQGLKSRGKTVFLTTHNMSEAEALADRVAIIAQGRIVAEGAPNDLKRRAPATRIAFESPNLELPARFGAGFENGRVVLETTDPTRTLNELTSWALEQRLTLDGLTVAQTTLEDVYLSLVGEETQDGGELP
jgi:ABC-2 type transport system ATP-binding protein